MRVSFAMVACASVLPLLLPSSAFAAAGVAVYVQGSVMAGARTLGLGADIDSGETILTGDASQVRVRLADGSLLRIGPNAKVELAKIERTEQSRSVRIKLTVGKLWASVSKWLGGENKFEIDTGSAVAGVRGTELIAERDSPTSDSKVTTVVGKVVVKNGDGSESTVDTGFRLTVNAEGHVVDLSSLPGSELSRMRDESRSSGGGIAGLLGLEQGARDVGQQAMQTSIGLLVGQILKSQNTPAGAADTSGVSAGELRQRGADRFGPLNDQVGSTQLKINVKP